MARPDERRAGALIRSFSVHGRAVTALVADGKDPTLLFLHYAGGNEGSLARLFDGLAGRARFAPSYPGRCGSEGDPLGSVEELAEWACAFLDAAGVDRTVAL